MVEIPHIIFSWQHAIFEDTNPEQKISSSKSIIEVVYDAPSKHGDVLAGHHLVDRLVGCCPDKLHLIMTIKHDVDYCKKMSSFGQSSSACDKKEN